MKLAIYAHFSTTQTVAQHILFYLEQLQLLNFRICFISNSPLDATAVLRLEGICDRVIQRENTGFDFAMWQQGIQCHDLSKYRELLLTNSSIIGPIKPLAPLWDSPGLGDCDFWGLTDNDELSRHLQSYFLVFREPVLQSQAFEQFWKSVLPFNNKRQVIRSYEIGLTTWLEQNGFTWSACFPQRDVIERYKTELSNRDLITKGRARLLRILNRPAKSLTLNTTLSFPDYLIEMGMPFLKLAVFKKAYGRIAPESAFKLLESTCLPEDAVEELRMNMPPLRTGTRHFSRRVPSLHPV